MTQSKSWIGAIVEALEELGGGGTLNEIYLEIVEKKLMDLKHRPNWQSTLRRTILLYSSDANIFPTQRKTNREKYDILCAPKGLHAGYWAIREEYCKTKKRREREESLSEQIQSIPVFYGHVPEDRGLQKELEKHLSSLRRQGHITSWDNQEVSATEWKTQTDAQLESALIILLLVSCDFIDSEYGWAVMERALERHDSGKARTIPILLRPGDYEDLPIWKLTSLPTNGNPVSRWPTHDDAFEDIAKGIKRAVYELLADRCLDRGDKDYNQQYYEEALAAYKYAADFDSNNVKVHISLANAFYALEIYTEALKACEKAIFLKTRSAKQYGFKGDILDKLGKYKEALKAYDQAIYLDPQFEFVYISKGNILMLLKNYEEALITFEQATKIATITKSNANQGKAEALYKLNRYQEALSTYEYVINNTQAVNIKVYQGYADTLYKLERYEEALTAYEHIISLDPSFSAGLIGKGNALCSLKCYDDSLIIYKQAIALDDSSIDAHKGRAEVFRWLALEEENRVCSLLDRTKS